ncbi:MAG TPA: hypothetical protein VMC61_00220, partial [Methanocella sp.]|nr:hypothetical protein [Methanocella sp.]
ADPTITPSPNASVSPSPSVTISPGPNATISPSPNATLTPTPDASATPSPRASVSPTAGPSASPTANPTTGTWFGIQIPLFYFFGQATASPMAQPWTPTPEPVSGNASTPAVTQGPNAPAGEGYLPLSGIDTILIVLIVMVLLSYVVILTARRR